MGSFRKRKLKLFEQNPHCHYCGVLTVLTEAGVEEYKDNPNHATIDHVYSRFDLRRWVCNNEERYVLSCRKCNNDRQAREFDLLPNLERWARGKGFNPRLDKKYPTLEEVYKAMRKIYERYGVPHDHLKSQLSS